MAVYYKPQSPIQSGEDFIYPITTADQVKVDKDTRLNAVGVYLKNIDNSTDTTVYGNNATTLGGVAAEDYALKTDTAPDSSKLGGVAASDYALKTDTAPDSSKLGGKAPEYYLQPRNLLDNSDFTNPVNQRGVTNTSAIGYCIDRWIFSLSGSGALSVQDGLLMFNASDGSYSEIVQIQESSSALSEKEMTFAVCIAPDNIMCLNFTYGTNASVLSADGNIALIHYDGDRLYIRFFSTGDNWIGVKWAALYEGTYTADTLPPYVPKGYAAELAECQRYYLPVSDYWNMGVVLTGTGYICLNIPTNIKMRISPTPIISNPRMYHPTYDWVNLTYRTLEWHAPFYRIIFDWPSNIQASISDIVLINGVTGLNADL